MERRLRFSLPGMQYFAWQGEGKCGSRLTFSYATLRPCDMVTVGCHTREEVWEDIEIALAAIERWPPDLEGRGSPEKSEIMPSG